MTFDSRIHSISRTISFLSSVVASGEQHSVATSNAILQSMEDLNALLEQMEEMADTVSDLSAYVQFLLEAHHLWSEEGSYTFPDGSTWYAVQ